MSTAELLLAVIAVAVAVMAVVQVGAIVAGLRVARRVERLANDVEHRMQPLIANLTTLTSEATRAANLAAGQVERFDRMVADLTARVDQTLAAAQHLVIAPAREGMAIVAGVKAAVSALKGMKDVSGKRRPGARAGATEDEEDSLFIG